jgi:hypothetical protein
MTTAEVIAIIAIAFGPFSAVLVSMWIQKRQRTKDTQMQVFLALMANRKAFPIEKDFVRALNLIDVVFAKESAITQKWHRYYDLLGMKPRQMDVEGHTYIELLSAIALHLGYDNIQQTDIDKFYLPEGLLPAPPSELETEFLRVLKNSGRFVVEPKVDLLPSTSLQLPELPQKQ